MNFGMKIDLNILTNYISNNVYNSTVTNMVRVWNFQVIANKFNVHAMSYHMLTHELNYII
jgi:hypothetical protein